MTQTFDIEALIKLRKQTRAISDALKVQASDYLSTLALLIRPQTFFGEYLQGAQRSSGRETQHHFKELKELYDRIASAEPFKLVNELEVPLNLISTTPELFPLEYDMVLSQSGQTIRITSPVRWVVGSTPSIWRSFARSSRTLIAVAPSCIATLCIIWSCSIA